MLSKSAKYAIRAVEFLVENQDEDRNFGVKEISRNIEVPTPFLSKILQQLSRERIIHSVKGPNGGFSIERTGNKKTLWDVVLCVDGKERFKECFLGSPQCNSDNPCSMHDMVMEFRLTLINKLKRKEIQALRRGESKNN